MVSSSVCAFLEENRGAVFAVLNDERPRSHAEDFACRARDTCLLRDQLGLIVVDQQDVDAL